jgi:hypothetical protein
MTFRLSLTALILWLSALPGFPKEANETLSVSEYVAELERLSAAVESSQRNPQSIKDIRRRLPSQWTVESEGRRYRINCEWLGKSIEEIKTQKSDAAFRGFLVRLAELKAGAQALQQLPPDVSSSRKALAGILARREFNRVHGPTGWDALREKIAAFILRLFQGISENSVFPTVSEMLVWILVAAATVALVFSIVRIARRSARLESIHIESSFVAAKSWAAWLEEARAAAEKGSWRDAVHLAYWAGISFLESSGAWRPDKARTPREYLRLVGSSVEYQSSLSALTRQFETIWYGGAAAGPDSFSEALNHLGGLGCPCR